MKASGYNAEYRGAIGGVISAVTKSGSNQWHGSAAGYFTSDKLQGAVRPMLQLNPAIRKRPSTCLRRPMSSRTGRGGDIGGPIRRDRLWFHGGYNPQATTTQRTVTFTSNEPGWPRSSPRPLDRIGNYNVTAQLTRTLRAQVAGSVERREEATRCPTSRPTAPARATRRYFPCDANRHFKDSMSGIVDWVGSSRRPTSTSRRPSHLRRIRCGHVQR